MAVRPPAAAAAAARRSPTSSPTRWAAAAASAIAAKRASAASRRSRSRASRSPAAAARTLPERGHTADEDDAIAASTVPRRPRRRERARGPGPGVVPDAGVLRPALRARAGAGQLPRRGDPPDGGQVELVGGPVLQLLVRPVR